MSDDIVEWLIDFSEATNNPRCADAADKIIGISSANRRLRAENEKLREALKPFANYYTLPTFEEIKAAAAAIRESGDE